MAQVTAACAPACRRRRCCATCSARWTSYRERPVAMADGHGSAGGRRSELPNIQVGSQENLPRLMLQDNQPWSRTSEPCPGRERLREEPRTGRANLGRLMLQDNQPWPFIPGTSRSPSRSRSRHSSILSGRAPSARWDLCRDCTEILSAGHIHQWIRDCDSSRELIYIIGLAAERLDDNRQRLDDNRQSPAP